MTTTTTEVDALADFFFECGLWLGKKAERRDEAGSFLDAGHTYEDAQRLRAYCQKSGKDKDPAGLMIHILRDTEKLKEVIAWYRKHGKKHSGPQLDMPTTEDEAKQKKANWNNMQVEEWERDRTHKLMYEMWVKGSMDLDPEARPRTMSYLPLVARFFGKSDEDTYDILDREAEAALDMGISEVVEKTAKQIAKAKKHLVTGAGR